MIESISMDEFLNLSDINIIDLRSVEKFNSNHIPGSINIPADKLILKPYDFLDKSLKYYLYCQRGLTSRNVCSILSRLGFRVVNINGGYESWILSNY